MNNQELYDALRYQVLTPRVTTMGPCANGCGNSARAAGICGTCLAKRLDAVLGNDLASAFVTAMNTARRSEAALEDAL